MTYLIRTLAWETILSDHGFVVRTLQHLHLISQGGRLLATATAVVTGITYNFLPFMALPLYVSLEKIDRRLLEAATDLYADMPERKREVYTLLVEACNALRRENHEILYASMIKDTMKRKKPSFDESYYGYRSFTHLLEEADNHALVDIERNPKSGTYVVTRFGEREAPRRLDKAASPGGRR